MNIPKDELRNYYRLIDEGKIEQPAEKVLTVKHVYDAMEGLIQQNARNHSSLKQFVSAMDKEDVHKLEEAANKLKSNSALSQNATYPGIQLFVELAYIAHAMQFDMYNFYFKPSSAKQQLPGIASKIEAHSAKLAEIATLVETNPGRVVYIPAFTGCSEPSAERITKVATDVNAVCAIVNAYGTTVANETPDDKAFEIIKDFYWPGVKAKIDASNDDELLKTWRKADWVNINSPVDSIIKALTVLYKSGIESLPHAGIILDNGNMTSPLVAVKCSHEENGQLSVKEANSIDSGFRYDLKILTALSGSFSNLNPILDVDETTGFPTYATLESTRGVLKQAHLMFQSANVIYSGQGKNKNSIRRWIKSTKDTDANEWLKNVNHNTTRLTRWSDVKDWYTWVIENTIYRYFAEAGLSPNNPSATALDMMDRITATFVNRIKNVVAVSERVSRGKQLQTTELKILSDTPFEAAVLVDSLQTGLNVGNARDITATARTAGNQVTSIRIIYDQEAANKSTKFAYEVVDALKDSGNTPSWEHVLLGRTQNGEFLFWDDFMHGQTASDRAYAIYAGSGSGKGNMTLTLLAAAIADKRQIFYTDGKPDSGASMAALAWRVGKEAYMFDGQPTGGDLFPGALEANAVTNGMRKPDETLKYVSSIPKGIFTTEAAVREFLGVCRYLRSLSLCADILTARGDGKLKDGNFQIWLFDEMTNMSVHERAIRRTFANYIASKGFKCAETKKDSNGQAVLVGMKPGKDLTEALKDKGIAYIADWLSWLVPIADKFNKLSTIGLRNADANIIFIFQNASWLSAEEDGQLTLIAKVVQLLKCRKFVGRNGLAKACGDYGDGNTMKAGWANTVAGAGGWWAVSDAADIRAEGTKMTIFQPYSIWGYRKPGDTKSDPWKFLDAYIDKLLGDSSAVGATLQASWDYAESAIQALAADKIINPAESLKDYVYNVSKFRLDGEEFDPSSISNEGDTGAADPTARYNQAIFDEESGETLQEPQPAAIDDTMDDSDKVNALLEEYKLSFDFALNKGSYDDMLKASTLPQLEKTLITPYVRQFGVKLRVDHRLTGGIVGGAIDDLTEYCSRSVQTRINTIQTAAIDTDDSMGGVVLDDPTESIGREDPQWEDTDKTDTPAMDDITTLLNGMGAQKVDAAVSGIDQFSGRPTVPTQGLNTIERPTSALAATDNATATKVDAQGNRVINQNQVRPENIKPVDNTNYVSVPIKLNNNVFETDNMRQLQKTLDNVWGSLLDAIVRACGGKGAVRQVLIDQNAVYVNGKMIDHGILDNDYIHGLDEVAFMPDLLSTFPGMIELLMAAPMFSLMDEQMDAILVKASVKAGKEISLPEFLLRVYPKLNKVVNITTKSQWTKRDLLNPTKDRAARIQQQLEEQRARKEQSRLFGKIGGMFGSKHPETADSRKARVQNARQAATRKRARGGMFSWFGQRRLLKHIK